MPLEYCSCGVPRPIVHDAMAFDATVHHRRSLRLPSWDYRERAAYFFTICTYERAPTFEDRQVARELDLAWRSIGRYTRARPDQFVVMPNHVHGIIWLPGPPAGRGAARETTDVTARSRWPLETSGDPRSACAAPLRGFVVDPGSLAAVVRAFKSNTTKRVNALRGTPGAPVWQRNYYEHVIRDDHRLERAREYIIDNPRRWGEDRHNPANVQAARSKQ